MKAFSKTSKREERFPSHEENPAVNANLTARMSQVDQGENASIHSTWIVRPTRQHTVLHFLDQFHLVNVVVQRMCRHIEQEKVLLLSAADAFINEILR